MAFARRQLLWRPIARHRLSTRLIQPPTCLPATRLYASKIPSHPRNEHILKKAKQAQLVDPETGHLTPLEYVERILNQLDRKKEYLELVAVEPKPIVKIVNRRAEADKERERKHKQRELGVKEVEVKEIQLTWGIASGDLQHKLKKVRKELEKGNLVDLVYAPKKGQAIPKADDITARLDETRQLLLDVGRERKRTLENNIAVMRIDGIRQTPSTEN